jgi:hypothetical protein
MLIAPTQSATPTPRQVNRMIYFHTIIAASKALQFTVAMRARSWVGSGQVETNRGNTLGNPGLNLGRLGANGKAWPRCRGRQ